MEPESTIPRRKLIEASIPLEKINEQSAREKSIRHGHPSTMHLWWSRKPTATARAVLFSQIVDDPSTRPDLFPTVEDQEKERRELFRIIEQISNWDTVKNDKYGAFDEAKARIQLYTGGTPPPVVDPFAGGGSIPLEAQRLGLEAHASDVNPVAVLLEKALIEIPAKFVDQPPIHPEADQLLKSSTGSTPWKGAAGLAEDVRHYGEWMLEQARDHIGHLYPNVTLDDGTEAPVIAWLWARTLKCPNPACGIDTPLTTSWWVSKKTGKEAYVIPKAINGTISYEVIQGKIGGPDSSTDGTINGRTGATCTACGASLSMKLIRELATHSGFKSELIATVAQGKSQRIYITPDDNHRKAAIIARPPNAPLGSIALNPRWFSPPQYGLTEFSDIFTPRQLTAVTTFSDLVSAAGSKAAEDAKTANIPESIHYGNAIATMLALVVDRCADYWSSVCGWHSSAGKMRNVFTRQAIGMSWNFAEAMPFSTASGGFLGQLDWVAKSLQTIPATPRGYALAKSALTTDLAGKLLSTDPPYYDYIGYSDLSDFFYVWLRRSLRSIYPELFNRTLVPKAEELVANPYRQGSKKKAKQFFEDGFMEFFTHARAHALPDYPITVYYAFKQQDADPSSTTSTGWETILEGIIRAGWQITATWPMRSEMTSRSVARGTNALASTIALVLRPRMKDASVTTRRDFLRQLKSTLPGALRDLQKGTIPPVDLPQSAIGPGMGLFSKYNGVLESDGQKMTVRSALSIINEILDEVLSEQEGDYDGDTRFALAWFRTYGFDSSAYGDADSLARARNTSVDHLMRSGILSSSRGQVHLYSPAELHALDGQSETSYDPAADESLSAWETVIHLAKELEYGNGVEGAGLLLARVPDEIDHDLCKQLAFLLFQISETRSEAKTALLFNQLGTAWNDIEQAARTAPPADSDTSHTLF